MAAVLWLSRLAFVILNVLVGVLFVMTAADFCGSVFESRVGYVLVGHVMVKSVVADEFQCQQKCLGNKTCNSFNVHPGADITKRICELNNKTRQMKPGDFKKKKGSIYYGSAKVSCVDTSRNKREQSASGHCHPEYKGKRCETPKLGWHPSHPAHSCKHIRDSGDSRGDGEYWIDTEKKGNPLKVHCDMTIDAAIWVKINTAPVCFGTRDEAYGSFTITQDGSIGSLKLVHLSGALVCHPTSTRSFWGCEVPGYGDKTLLTIISYPKHRSVLLPRQSSTQMGVPGVVCASEFAYKLNGFDDTSPEIVFNTTSEPLPVVLHQEFHIWFGQDMADCSETNNLGQSCVDVYGWYM